MAKTKQDYYNDGFRDAQENNERRFSGNESWQSQMYSNGWVAGSGSKPIIFENIGQNMLNILEKQNKIKASGMRVVSAQRKRELRKRGIVCQYLYTTVNGKARYGWTKNA